MSHKITDKCKGCDDCAEICPVRAITGEMKEMHEIDPNRCIDCGACCNVCEYESIRDQFDRPTKYTPKENWKKPVIDAKLCNGCSLCVEDCPAYALEITPPGAARRYPPLFRFGKTRRLQRLRNVRAPLPRRCDFHEISCKHSKTDSKLLSVFVV